MTAHFALVLAALLSAATLVRASETVDAPVSAVEAWQEDPARIFTGEEATLEEFQWVARPVVVFADTPADPRFRQQMELLMARIEELAARDVVVITDTNPAAKSSVRLHLRPRGFMLALLDKDGSVVLRKPFPWDVRELSRSIDKMPLRRQEIRDGAGFGG